jgi:PGF-pre-PGF domain-containing protein
MLMLKSRSFLKFPSHKQKPCEKNEPDREKPWRITATRTCIISAVFTLLLSLCAPVSADSFPPTPSQHIVDEETSILVSLTAPVSTVFINVTEYDAKQIVKNVTAEFREPVTYVSFTWKVLGKRPSYLEALDNSTVLKYYAITFSTGATDEIVNVKMDFAIEKDAEQKRDIDEERLLLYRYNGETMEECAMEKGKGENDDFVYFRTEAEGASSYVVVTGGITSSPWWFAVVIIVVAALVTLIGIYGYKKFKVTNLRKTSGAAHGK